MVAIPGHISWLHSTLCKSRQQIPYGLAVRIPGFHPGGPGSTPGIGKDSFSPFLLFLACVCMHGKNAKKRQVTLRFIS